MPTRILFPLVSCVSPVGEEGPARNLPDQTRGDPPAYMRWFLGLFWLLQTYIHCPWNGVSVWCVSWAHEQDTEVGEGTNSHDALRSCGFWMVKCFASLSGAQHTGFRGAGISQRPCPSGDRAHRVGTPLPKGSHTTVPRPSSQPGHTNRVTSVSKLPFPSATEEAMTQSKQTSKVVGL